MSGVKHSFIDEVLAQVRFKFDHSDIRQELEEHIEDMLFDYLEFMCLVSDHDWSYLDGWYYCICHASFFLPAFCLFGTIEKNYVGDF